MAGQRIDRHGDPCLRILSHRKLDMHGLDVHVDSRDGPYDPGHARLVERLAESNPSSIRNFDPVILVVTKGAATRHRDVLWQ